MKRLIYAKVFLFCILTNCYGQNNIISGRNQSFDSNWKFKKYNKLDFISTTFKDDEWRTIDVPHDWSIEDLTDLPSDSIIGPFYKNSIGKQQVGFTVGGTASYRKTFLLDKTVEGKKVFIQFDGVYMNADVWINGHHLGRAETIPTLLYSYQNQTRLNYN